MFGETIFTRKLCSGEQYLLGNYVRGNKINQEETLGGTSFPRKYGVGNRISYIILFGGTVFPRKSCSGEQDLYDTGAC